MNSAAVTNIYSQSVDPISAQIDYIRSLGYRPKDKSYNSYRYGNKSDKPKTNAKLTQIGEILGSPSDKISVDYTKQPPSNVKFTVIQPNSSVAVPGVLNNNILIKNPYDIISDKKTEISASSDPDQSDYMSNPVSQVIIPVAVDTGLYLGVESLLYGIKKEEGSSFKSVATDSLLFAVSDGVSLLGVKQYLKNAIGTAVNMPDSLIVDYLAYVLSTDGSYMLFNMAAKHHKEKWHLFLETTGVYAVNTLYYYYLANKIGS